MDTEKQYFRQRDDASTDSGAILIWYPSTEKIPPWWGCVGAQWGNSRYVNADQIIEQCAADAPGAFLAEPWMRLSWDCKVLERISDDSRKERDEAQS